MLGTAPDTFDDLDMKQLSDTQAVLSVSTHTALDAAVVKAGAAIVGEQTYTVVSATSTPKTDHFAFVESVFAPQILPWVGGVSVM